MITYLNFHEKMEKFLQEKSYQTDNFNPPMLTLLNEIGEKAKKKKNLKSNRKFKVLPGSYKSVLNRRNKDFGCLFWESKARNENGTVRSKVEGDFILLARKRFKKIRISGTVYIHIRIVSSYLFLSFAILVHSILCSIPSWLVWGEMECTYNAC